MRPNRGAFVVLVCGVFVALAVLSATTKPGALVKPWELGSIPSRTEYSTVMTGILVDRHGVVVARPVLAKVGRRTLVVIERPFGAALADVGIGRTTLLLHGIQGNLSGLMRTGAESMRPYERPGTWSRFLVGDPVLTAPPIPTTRLTIDAELTRRVFAILGRYGNKGSAVVMDALSGELLVLADFPGPDVSSDKEPNARNSLDALHGSNLPASTMKVLTGAYILERRPADAGRSHFCTGDRCWTRHGRVPGLPDALARSCNMWFRLTVATWTRSDWLQFVIDTGLQPVDTPGIPLTPVVFVGHSDDRMHWPQAVGQQVWVSMIGLASAYSTLTSADGRRVNPSVVLKSGFTRGTPKVVQPDVALRMRQLLRVTATRGTARIVNQIYRGEAGGKTGTGEVEGRTSDSVFAAVAPWNQPRWVVVVSIKGGGRGTNAGRAAGEILNTLPR